MVGNSSDDTCFPNEFLLTDTLDSRICKIFANGSSANITLSNAQLSKTAYSGGCNLFPVMSFSFDPYGVLSKKNGGFRTNAYK